MLTKTIWFISDGGAPNDFDYIFGFTDNENHWGNWYESKEDCEKEYKECPEWFVMHKMTILIEKEERN